MSSFGVMIVSYSMSDMLRFFETPGSKSEVLSSENDEERRSRSDLRVALVN